MNKKKLIAKTVGAFIGRPHFGENTLESPTAYTNSKSKIKTLTSDNKAITLIALVITIIVMLILVAVTVTIAINGGLLSTAKQATTDTQYHADREMLLSAVIGAINNDAEVDFTELDKNLPDGFTGNNGTYTSEAGNTFYVGKNGNITDEKVVTPGSTGPQVTLGDQTVTLTPENVGEYLGKVVTNYKKDYDTTTTESITIDEKEYTVSTKYRLYYVDFDNKYKDGAGTIYLKADCTGNSYILPRAETTPMDPTTDLDYPIKIKNLNPGLYYEEDDNGLPMADLPITPPWRNNTNMEAVTWLTDTTNWKGLMKEETLDEIKVEDINYVVGAPSLEMMMDSYNTHYELTGDKPDTKTLNEDSERVRLFYKYPYGDKNIGYGVGPSNSDYNDNGYSLVTSHYSVKPDGNIGSLYYPDCVSRYWLSSPSGIDVYYWGLMAVYDSNYGFVQSAYYNEPCAFCPLVSLDSSVRLKLK